VEIHSASLNSKKIGLEKANRGYEEYGICANIKGHYKLMREKG